ncbi:MAG: hypothetical protein JXP34_25705 [Planctomycetes bacterium]|nr:hypothetical protein [Planctomycetota bacterium]
MEPTPLIYGARARIERVLRALERRVRWAALARGAGRTLLVLAAAVALTLAIDWLFVLEPTARAIISGICAAFALGFAVKSLLLPALSRIPADGLAAAIERTHPILQDRLRSAITFAGDLASYERQGLLPRDLMGLLKARVIGEASRLSDVVVPSRALDPRAVVRPGAAGLAAVVAIAGASILAPEFMGAWLSRNVFLRDVPWPHDTTLIVEGFEDGVRRIPRGDDIEIVIRAEGAIPRRVRIRMRFPDESAVASLANRGDDRFAHMVREVLDPFRFRVDGGDYRSPEHRVEVIPRPEIASLRIEAHYPAHTGKAPQAFEGGIGEISIPGGTRLDIAGDATKRLARAVLRSGDTEFQAGLGDSGTGFEASFVPSTSGPLSIALEDDEGIGSRSPATILVRIVPDADPNLRLETPQTSGMVTPKAKIPTSVRIRDDYGIASAALAWTARGEEGEKEGKETLALGDTKGPDVEIDRDWEIAPLELAAGMRLHVVAEATDNDAVSGPKTGRSNPIDLRVVSPEEFMEEMIRRQQHERREWERAIVEEKAARDALYGSLPEIRTADPLPDEIVQALVAGGRLQREFARRASAIARSLASILKEMENNRVGEADDIRRLAERVVQPIEALIRDGFPALAGGYDGVRAGVTAQARGEAGAALADEIEKTIVAMEAVLANMVKLEDFSEIVKRLRVILDLQDEATETARKAFERELQEIFK